MIRTSVSGKVAQNWQSQGLSIYRDGTLRKNSWAILGAAILNNYEISREHGAANLNNYENTWLSLRPNEMITDRFPPL